MVQTISTPTKVFQRTVMELKGLGFDVELNQNKSICIRKGVHPVATVFGELANIFDLNYTATTQCLDNTERMLLADLTYKLACIMPANRILKKMTKLYAVYLPDDHFNQRYYVAKFEKGLAIIPSFAFDINLRTHLFTMEEIESFEETFRGFDADYIREEEEQI